MKIKHWLTALCALTMAPLLTVPAAAEDDTGGVGGTALMWAIISKKQAKKEAAA